MRKFLARREVSLLIVLGGLMALAAVRAPEFLRPSNLYDILNDTGILIIASLGQFLVILAGGGGIDLSVSSTVGLTGMSVAMLNQHFPGLPIPAIVAASLLIGWGLGSFNGFLVAGARIPPIIATLGTMSIYRGLIFIMSGGQWVSAHEMSGAFKDLPRITVLGVTSLLWITFAIVVLAGYFMHRTATGRGIYALGGNATAAVFAGIRIRLTTYLVFAASGVLAGLAGLLWVARYASAQNETASGFEMQTIAACVIGGVSIAGGAGTVAGVVLGALFVGLLNNALTVVNISPFFQMALQGTVILTAIVLNTLMDRHNQLNSLRRRRL